MNGSNVFAGVVSVMLLSLLGTKVFATEFTAKWIWADVQVKAPFQNVMFEKEFSLDSIPEKAEVYITADTFYRLRINGAFVMHGPARSSARHATVDVVDIKPYLRVGRNTLQSEAVYGNFMFEALAQAPGFLCEIRTEKAGKQTIIASDESWKSYELTAWDRSAPKSAFQRGWVEDIDGRKDINLAWRPAVVLGEVGIKPWTAVEIRDIPLPAVKEEIRPREAVAVIRAAAYNPENLDSTLSFAQGSSVLPMNHWVCRLERESVNIDKSAAVNAGGVTQSGHGDVILNGEGAEVVYDFAANQVGFIGFEVIGKSGQVIELCWNERLSSNGNVPRPGEYDSSINALRYTLRDGKQTFLAFTPTLARFVRVVNRSNENIKLHSLYIKEYRFQAPKAGDFTCSDDEINSIYNAARLTATLNTLDVFMDCPSRERGSWLHDSYWTAQAVYAMFGDTSVNRRMCRQVAESQDDPNHVGPEGMVHMLYPADIKGWPVVIPGHQLFWVLQVGLDEQFTGDTSYTRRILPSIRQMFKAFEDSCNSQGLLEVPFKWQSPQLQCWNFIDWSDTKTDGVNIGLNAIYAVALDRAAAMERLAGDLEIADNYSSHAAHIREIIEKNCPGDGYYPDSLIVSPDGSLTPSQEMCETTQYYAIWSGIAPEPRARKLWAKLRDAFQPTPMSRVQPIDGLNRAGFYTFPERLNIAVKFGDYDAFLRDIKLMCLPMVQSAPGTLWETPWANNSLCHGLGSTVAAMLTENTLGIKLSLPITISPQAIGHLKWAKGYITTPKGKVSVDWKLPADKYVLNASIPDGESALVILPAEAKQIWSMQASDDKWQDSIQIDASSSITVVPGAVRIKPIQ